MKVWLIDRKAMDVILMLKTHFCQKNKTLEFLLKKKYDCKHGQQTIIFLEKRQLISKANYGLLTSPKTWILISSFKYFWVVRIEKQIHLFIFWRSYGSTILFRDLLTFKSLLSQYILYYQVHGHIGTCYRRGIFGQPRPNLGHQSLAFGLDSLLYQIPIG